MEYDEEPVQLREGWVSTSLPPKEKKKGKKKKKPKEPLGFYQRKKKDHGSTRTN